MRAFLLILTVALAAVVIGAVAFAATPAVPDATPAQTIAKQKRTIEALRDQRAELRQDVDDLEDTNARLRARLAAVPDPLDAITSRNPDALWAAVQAIWAVFPTLPPGGACGYDKTSTANNLLTPESYTFSRWQVC